MSILHTIIHPKHIYLLNAPVSSYTNTYTLYSNSYIYKSKLPKDHYIGFTTKLQWQPFSKTLIHAFPFNFLPEKIEDYGSYIINK